MRQRSHSAQIFRDAPEQQLQDSWNPVLSGHAGSQEAPQDMSDKMPDSITQVLLAALNAADEALERDAQFAGPLRAEMAPVAEALAELTRSQVVDCYDERPNRFAATICLSMDKLRSAS